MKTVLKKLIAGTLAAFIIVAAIPVFSRTVGAQTLASAPEKDRAGYTPISSIKDLDKIRNDLDGKYYLTCDLNMDYAHNDLPDYINSGWKPIGEGYAALPVKIKSEEQFYAAYAEYGELFAFDSESQSFYAVYEYIPSVSDYRYHKMFTGIFDGNGHTVKNLKIMDGYMGCGLFGVSSGVIQNLSVTSCDIRGYMEDGSICGINYGIITECYASGSVYGYSIAGGICGTNYGLISECERGSGVSNATMASGGIVGANFGYIENCTNDGTAQGQNVSGGIAGVVCGSSMTMCVNRNTPRNNTGTVGYLAGMSLDDLTSGNLYNGCIYTGTIAEYIWYDGETYHYIPFSNGIRRLNTEEAAKQSSYEKIGFDFESLWYMDSSNKAHPVGSTAKSAFKCSAVWDGTVADGFARGKGTRLNPYVITTAAELAYFAKAVNSGNSFEGEYIELGADIILNDTSVKYWFKNAAEFTPIGTAEAPFSGIFNGKSHNISGVYCDDPVYEAAGLFGYVFEGSISNVNAEVYIDALACGGGICGFLDGGVINNCNASGFCDGISYAGLICGASTGEIILSGASGGVNSTYSAGGICGFNTGDISRCMSEAYVFGSDFCIGGICGENYGNISDCYNSGNVNGEQNVGGICGLNFDGLITECYSVGAIYGFSYTASIGGRNEVIDSTKGIRNCYYLKWSAKTFSNAEQNGEGTEDSYARLPDKSGETKEYIEIYFKAYKTYKNFDFDSVWTLDPETEYPYAELRKPEPEVELIGDVNGDGTVNSIDSNMLKRNLTDSTVEVAFDEADINIDGSVNAIDSNMLKRMIAGNT